ncbi:MAG: WD40 repeat domain-containing serine/threonine-protein kinase [Planctomycetota bacterium]
MIVCPTCGALLPLGTETSDGDQLCDLCRDKQQEGAETREEASTPVFDSSEPADDGDTPVFDATVDGDATVTEDSASKPPATPAAGVTVDENATVAEGGTVDFDHTPEEEPAGDENATPVFDATVDIDQPASGEADEHATDHFDDATVAGGATVDFDTGEPDSTDKAGAPNAGGTIDFDPDDTVGTVDLQVDDAAQTIDLDTAESATVDLDAGADPTDFSLAPDSVDETPAGRAPPTLHGAAADNATVDLEGRPPGATPAGLADATRAGGDTADAAAMSLDSRLKKMWRAAEASDGSPSATLQVELKHLGGESLLSVSSRPVLGEEAAPNEKGDYRIEKFLAKGGMGRVYLAQQSSLGRTVALKTLSDELAAKDRYRQKFFAEASITGLLDHPNIVPIHDLGVQADGVPFYSMKFVTGEPWSDSILQKSKSENLSILLQVADGVAFAHSRRILHRDLKPENVMLGEYGEVLVVDWGLAVHLDRDKEFSLGGTPLYMAPEMANHEVENINERSDVYLLGAMLFEVLEGKAPHESGAKTATERILTAAMNKIVPHKSADELMDVALKALATKPADRYADAREFQDAVRECQRHADSRERAERAAAELDVAKHTGDNERFARAMFAYQDAVDLWPENGAAQEGLNEARIAYAEHALAERDYGLGLSLLDEADESHRPLREQLLAAQDREAQRGRRLRLARNAAIAATVATVASLSGFAWFANNAAIKQRKLTNQATASAAEAREQRTEAERQKDIAEGEAMNAREAEALEREAKKAAQNSAAAALKAQKLAEAAEDKASKARAVAVANEAIAKRRAFVAEVALTAADLAVADTDTASERLARIEQTSPELLDWEAGRLRHLSHGDFARVEMDDPIAQFVSTPPLPVPDGTPAPTVVAALAGDPETTGARLLAGTLDPATGKALLAAAPALPGVDPTLVALGPGGLTAVAGTLADRAGVIAVLTPDGVKQVAVPPDGREVTALAFSPTGAELAVAHHRPMAVRVEVLPVASLPPSLDPAMSTAAEYRMAGEGRFTRVAFSADGTRLAAVEQAGEPSRVNVTVWSRQSPAGEFTGKTKLAVDARSVAFNPLDSSRLAVGAAGGELSFWRLSDGDATPEARLMEHADDVTEVAYTPSGKRLATASVSGRAFVWRRSDDEQWRIDNFPPVRHLSPLTGVAWTADGQTLVTADREGLIRSWPLPRFYDVRKLATRADAANTIAPTKGGRVLIGDSQGHTLLVDPARPTEPVANFFVGHPGESIAQSWLVRDVGSRSTHLATLAFADGAASLVRWRDGTRFALNGVDQRDSIDLSPDGKTLAAASLQAITLLDVERSQVLARGTLAASSLAFLPSGRLLVGDARGRLSLMRAEGGQLVRERSELVAPRRDVRLLASQRDSSSDVVYAVTDEPRPAVYRVAIDPAGAMRVEPLPRLDEPIDQITAIDDGVAVRLSRSGEVLVSDAGGDAWRPGSQADLTPPGSSEAPESRSPVLLAFDDGVNTISISRDGRERRWSADQPNRPNKTTVITDEGKVLLAACNASADRVAVAAESRLGVAVRLRTPEGWRTLPAGSPFSTRARLAIDDARVIAWDPTPGRLTTWRLDELGAKPETWQEGTARSVAGDAAIALGDGGRVAVATPSGDDQQLLLWSSEADQPKRHTLEEIEATALAFSPSGRRLFIGTSTGRIVLYDVSTNTAANPPAPRFDELMSFAEHRRPITTLRFSPDGKTLYSADEQGVGVVWPTR